MRRHAKAPPVGPSRRRRILAALGAAAVLVLAFAAAPASAVAPTVTMGAVSDVSYTSAKASGELDPGDNDTYYSFEYSLAGADSWSGFQSLGPVPANSGNQALPAGELTGLQPGTEYEARLVASNLIDPEVISAGPNPTFTTDPVGPPTVSIDPVTAFTDSSAHFEGTIDPEAPEDDPAFEVDWHFECTPACPNLSGDTPPIPADSDPHTVEADATGLEPNTDYEVRLVASNAAGPVEAGPESFKTTQLAPEAQTLYAGELTTEGAILAGQVNPKNAPVTYQFEWGTDTSYGNVAPAGPESLGAANNSFNVVTAPLAGLEPGTTYHFRLVATNTETSAVSEGLDHTFTTLESAGPLAPCTNTAVRSQQQSEYLSDCRAYEQVSTGDKGILSVDTSVGARAISADGTRSLFATIGSPDASQGYSGASSRQFAVRDSIRGWISKPISPPARPSSENQYTAIGGSVGGFSEDLVHSFVGSASAFSPDAVAGQNNLYMQDNISGDFQLLSRHPESTGQPLGTQISADAHSAAFVYPSPQTDEPGITPGYLYPYLWRDGAVSLAGVLPDPDGAGPLQGEPPPFGALPGSGLSFGTAERAFSRDGRRLVFHARIAAQNQSAPFDSYAGQIYVREDDGVDPARTIHVTASHRTPPDPAGPLPPLYWSAEAEHGSKVLFTSCEKLTDDSTADAGADAEGCASGDANALGQMINPGRDLYLFDVDTGQLEDLTTADPAGADVMGVVGASDSLDTIYFVAAGVLDDEAQSGKPNLYIYRDGIIQYIATLLPSSGGLEGDGANWSPTSRSRSDGYNRENSSRVSTNGDFALITSRLPLTGYDNTATDGSCNAIVSGGTGSISSKCREVFRYDARSGELACVSCGAAEIVGDASLFLFTGQSGLSEELPRNLTTDGKVFFESPDPLVANDANGMQDVYAWSNGTLSLISSGSSPEASYFFDATPSGSDVLFRTHQALIGSDHDLVADIYDARTGGGFFEAAAPTPCSGDGCRNPLGSSPADSSPATPTFSGSGNVRPQQPRCAKSKVKRKGKCVSRKHKKQRRSGKRAANSNRGGAK